MRDKEITPTLLVEIGGTHTRCAVSVDGEPPAHIALFDNVDHPDLESVVDAYLASTGPYSPGQAALAVAAPSDGPRVRLTNLGWTVDTEDLKARFDWSEVILVNDFEALASALPWLTPQELVTIRAGTPVDGAPLAVLGPGTGLGVAALVPCGGCWHPVDGEGGHVSLPAADEREQRLVERLREQHGHVSAERVLSGPGLLALHRLLAPEAAVDAPADVTRLGAAGDRAAAETLEVFFGFLGTVAGDLALTLGARGGVYLGGGILPALRGHPAWSAFRRRFVAKGRFESYLTAIPVSLIIARTPALSGLAHHPAVARAGRGSLNQTERGSKS